MNATIYGRGQMAIRARARKEAGIKQGDVVHVQPEGDGRIVLQRLERPKETPAKVKITRRKGRHSVASSGRPITSEQGRALINELL